ncbi:MAG: hypothetical protein ABS32_07865 [Verrucomicrobia subdivision 6 bacterium BACL9 MAG-120820-bin42]|jgi:hypothetical protein|uniref:Uncharacterized protein n=1 Tax=Verrucomicrobia subdivision 6 bacterium BACL9 MAG-120820-bin42 TaxID=1655634 RepID=A0A0R2X4U6_9BACT|nr:MAG: hypothetical protein ABS32_07865 [Verrucomicrobia subdivision 6 bacterium BACL9 MAG-120820-bin42]
MTKFGPASLSPLILVLPLLLGACASGGGGKNADGTPKDEESVTTTPWNKPASWEGGAGIPGMGGSR